MYTVDSEQILDSLTTIISEAATLMNKELSPL